jgi:LacI family transcriptional regulator
MDDNGHGDGDGARRPRIIDIALQAGLSTATVDRVVNGRSGVREKTVRRVEEAIVQLARAAPRPTVIPAVSSGLRVDVVIAGQAGFANDVLSQELRQAAGELGLSLNLTYPKRMNPGALVEALNASRTRGSDGVVVQAVDHPSVREAVGDLKAAGIPVVAILTNLPDADLLGYVGLDNRVAGRTAGLLMGRLCRRPGEVAVFTGGNLYRNHEEREIGFRSVIRGDFNELSLLPECLGYDDPERNYRLAAGLLAGHAGLVGIFNVGGGNRGIERALLESGRGREVVYVAFNLTPLTRAALLQGTIDAVVHQDMAGSARRALGAIIDHARGREVSIAPTRLEIVMRENVG